MQIEVNIYTVSTVNNAPIETLLQGEVTGYMERIVQQRSTNIENKERSVNSVEYLFIPDISVLSIAIGQIMRNTTTNTEAYLIVDFENFEDHNEIYCRPVVV